MWHRQWRNWRSQFPLLKRVNLVEAKLPILRTRWKDGLLTGRHSPMADLLVAQMMLSCVCIKLLMSHAVASLRKLRLACRVIKALLRISSFLPNKATFWPLAAQIRQLNCGICVPPNRNQSDLGLHTTAMSMSSLGTPKLNSCLPQVTIRVNLGFGTCVCSPIARLEMSTPSQESGGTPRLSHRCLLSLAKTQVSLWPVPITSWQCGTSQWRLTSQSSWPTKTLRCPHN